MGRERVKGGEGKGREERASHTATALGLAKPRAGSEQVLGMIYNAAQRD